jgi:alcohol dehydrogenase class IV
MRFTHETLPQRVVFATGGAAAAVAAELDTLRAARVMVIASERQEEVVDAIASAVPVVVRHDEVVRHVPVEVAERARVVAAEASVDAVVSVGGGSATGLAKAVARDPGHGPAGLPILAVPTTYAGSEATDVWGLTQDGTKTTGADARVLPRAVVYDATLLASLPADLAVASGLNALAHGIDAMWGPRVDPIDRALAGEGIRALAAGLPLVAGRGSSLPGIERMLYGGYLAAVAFASAGSGMHHKICHVLGGMFDLPHAQTHAVVLPYVLAFNAPNALEEEARIAEAFGTSTAEQGLAVLRAAVGAPRALKDLGMPEDGIVRAVGPVLAAVPENNPTELTEENVAALLRAAWEGEPA